MDKDKIIKYKILIPINTIVIDGKDNQNKDHADHTGEYDQRRATL